MSKVESSNTSGALLQGDEHEPTLGEQANTKVAQTLIEAAKESFTSLSGFSAEQLESSFSDAQQYFAHSQQDLDDTARHMAVDPKKAFATMNQGEADWCLSQFSDAQQKAVLDALDSWGMTNKTGGKPVPAGAPKPPALYEVNDHQPPAVQKFLHETNVRAAREYDSAYDAYASTTAKPAPYVNLQEPGSRASLEEEMTLGLARGVGDYASGKLDDAKTAGSVMKQARKLSPGDELQLQLSLDGVVDGGAAGTSVSLKVKREGDEYRVSPQSALTVGGQLDSNKKFSVGGAFGGEYHCKTLNEVDRLTGVLKQQALGRAISADDTQFLDTHCSGLDLKGTAAAKLAGELGKGVKAGAGLKSDTSVHVDLEARTLTVSQKFTGDLNGQIGSNEKVLANKPGWKVTNSVDSGLTGDVTVTSKYSLPANASIDTLMADPSGTLSALARQAKQTEGSVKVHLQAGVTNPRAVDVEAKAKDVDAGAVLQALVSTGAVAAAETLTQNAKASVKVDEMTVAQHNFAPRLGGTTNSFSAGLKSQRIHHDSKEVSTLKQAWEQLTR